MADKTHSAETAPAATTGTGSAKHRSEALIGEAATVIRAAIGPSSLDTPRAIFDLSTGLPALTSLFQELRPVSESAQGITVLYVHIPASTIVEERFGWEALEAYRGLIANYLIGFTQDLRREHTDCILARIYADDFVIIACSGESDDQLPTALADGMNRHLSAIDEETATLMQVYVGMARSQPYAKVHPERLLYRLIQQSQTEATDVGRQRVSANVRILDRCIAGELFTMVYQPIVRLTNNDIFAYEALVRCRQKELRSPHVLFNVAEQGDRIRPLSRLLRRIAVQAVSGLPSQALMFVNLHPQDFDDAELLQANSLIEMHAPRLVFEVTERAAIKDFAGFRQKLASLRELGVRIAIDDLGSGYSALSLVAELEPDYIKLDMTLIRGIEESPVRQNLVRSLVSFAQDLGAEVVAEGVETRPELVTVYELGCQLVQGYYLAMPSPPFVQSIEVPLAAQGL